MQNSQTLLAKQKTVESRITNMIRSALRDKECVEAKLANQETNTLEFKSD